MKIVLDDREIHLYEKLIPIVQDKEIITKKTLPLGDILINKDDNSELLLIERKTITDLLSSIKDGRYEEQSYRLIHSSGIPPHNIIYIIGHVLP